MLKKVLIIEDSPTDAAIVKELLAKENIDVQIADKGNEGLEKARKIKPDLIILDLMLPDISGFEVCSQIRKDPSLEKTMIVILSIKDDVSEITKAFREGADDYMIKPPVPDFLTRKIKLYLGIR